MSTALKPLLLPQLVEERKRRELEAAKSPRTTTACVTPNSSFSSGLSSLSPATPISLAAEDAGFAAFSSVSMAASAWQDGMSPPPSVVERRHVPDTYSISNISDPEDDIFYADHGPSLYQSTPAAASTIDLYDCFCDHPCRCQPHVVGEFRHQPTHSLPAWSSVHGFALAAPSHGESDMRTFSFKRRRAAYESTMSTWRGRVGSRLTPLHRFKRPTSKRPNLSLSVTTEPFVHQSSPPLAHVKSTGHYSSASSTATGPTLDHVGGGDFSLSRTTSLGLGLDDDDEEEDSHLHTSPGVRLDDDARQGLERDRAMTATPLLPPLLDEHLRRDMQHTPQSSPLESPTMVPASSASSPPLSATPSLCSRPCATGSSIPSSPLESSSPTMEYVDQHDAWSDRLGHANFTITPKPYLPDTVDAQSLERLRADWACARTNFAKHLVRTGEHYGTTSKTYAMTQAKWAEIEAHWNIVHGSLVHQIDKQAGHQYPQDDVALSAESWRPVDEKSSNSHSGSNGGGGSSSISSSSSINGSSLQAPVPRIAHKFPELGDGEIVGLMTRDAYMVRGTANTDRRPGARFWKTLVGKVGLRR